MIKRMLITGVFAFSASIAGASFVNWTSRALSDDAEVGARLESGWVVGLYKDSLKNNNSEAGWYNNISIDNFGDVVSSGATSDDVFLGVTTVLQPYLNTIELKTITSLSVEDNAYVYSVIFDAASVASSAFFVVADSETYDVKITNPAVDYNLGNSIAGNFKQVIPEPAVASFIAIFGIGIIFTKRIFGKA